MTGKSKSNTKESLIAFLDKGPLALLDGDALEKSMQDLKASLRDAKKRDLNLKKLFEEMKEYRKAIDSKTNDSAGESANDFGSAHFTQPIFDLYREARLLEHDVEVRLGEKLDWEEANPNPTSWKEVDHLNESLVKLINDYSDYVSRRRKALLNHLVRFHERRLELEVLTYRSPKNEDGERIYPLRKKGRVRISQDGQCAQEFMNQFTENERANYIKDQARSIGVKVEDVAPVVPLYQIVAFKFDKKKQKLLGVMHPINANGTPKEFSASCLQRPK